MQVFFKKLVPSATIPTKAHKTDAGFDLTATSRVFDKDGNATYGTGIAVEIPPGYVGLVFPRSSIAVRDLSLSNAVGVIDSGYRGEIMAKFKPALVYIDRDYKAPKVLWPNGIKPEDYQGSDQTDLSTQQVTFHGRGENYPDVREGLTPFPPRVYEVGDRIAQLIIIPLPEVEWKEVKNLAPSDRNTGGFGSTGK